MRLDFPRKTVIAGFAICILLLSLLAIFSVDKSRNAMESSRLVAHTNAVLYHSRQVLSTMIDVETGQRGFLVTGDSLFLDPYIKAIAIIDAHYDTLVRLTADNERQQKRLIQLKELIANRNKLAAEVIAIRDLGVLREKEFAKLRHGKNVMDEIRHLVSEIESEEHVLLAHRSAAVGTSSESFYKTFYSLLFFSIIILIILFLVVDFKCEAIHAKKQELQKASVEIQDLYDNAPCGYHSLDANGMFLNINNTFLKWLGYERHEVVGKLKFSDIITLHSTKTFNEHFSTFKESGFVSNLKFDVVRKDGSIFPILLNSAALKDRNGAYIKSRTTVFDVTEIKKAEDKIKQLAALKSRFVAIVSHEFRTPLKAIAAAVELIKKGEESEMRNGKLQIKFDEIDRSVKFMTSLLDDVLTLEKSESPVMRAQYTVLNVLTIMGNIIEEVRAATGQSHNIHLEFAMQSAWICSDEKLLKNIFVNLLTNGIKYSPGKSQISLILSEKGSRFFAQIKDQGIGIPYDEQEKVFEVFQRGANVENIAGTGLGLSIVKKAVQILGGEVALESKPGEGTTFSVVLPKNAELAERHQ